MSEYEHDIDWSKTTFEGSRREQLNRWRALTLRQRLEALDGMTDTALKFSGAPPRFAPHDAAGSLTVARARSVREQRSGYGSVSALNEILLHGCTPTPLASYLKALAIVRLVAEAGDDGGGDAGASGFWRSDVFVLRTRLTGDELRAFFLNSYRPTPLIAPWNGGSGFYIKDNKGGIKALLDSPAGRFSDYRAAIAAGHSAVARFKLTESPKQEGKSAFLKYLRNVAPDALLRWMDAAVILSDDDPRYPPLLGTGGNDGRLDFTNNFMQRLAEIVETSSGSPCAAASKNLDAALFGTPTDSLSDRAIGQFSPGAAGGPNASSGFEGDPRINPWEFVLMLEGAVLFAASATRRLESSDPAILAAPFTVRSRAGTSGSASATDDGDARGEIWMPLWQAPCSLDELRCLLAEGRAALNGHSTRDGLDFARAVAQLGVDRGIDSFQRYGFLMRSGKAFLATPLNRIQVRCNPDADLITELERGRWLASIQQYARDDTAPNAFRSAARKLDIALFSLTQRSDRTVLQTALRCIGRIESTLSISPKSRDAIRAPAPRLSQKWATKAGGQNSHDSAEFRIAAALAGLRMRDFRGHLIFHTRRHFSAVSESINKHGDRKWEPTSLVKTWGAGPITGNLAALFRRRFLEASKIGQQGEILASDTGASCDDVADFLNGSTDDARISELVAGLSCVDLYQLEPPKAAQTIMLPPAFALLKIFFTSDDLLHRLKLGWLSDDRTIHVPEEVSARLLANEVDAAVQIVWRRLRTFGVKLPGRDAPQAAAAYGPRWLAALCIPLTYVDTAQLVRSIGLHGELEREAATYSSIRR